MDFIIEKSTITNIAMQPIQTNTYTIKYFKTATDVNGNPVQVIDDSRIETVSVEQLKANIARRLDENNEDQAKLDQIAKL